MSREVKKICEPCDGRGVIQTQGGILVMTTLGAPRPCHYCGGRGWRVFEEFTEEEFRARFPKGVPLTRRDGSRRVSGG